MPTQVDIPGIGIVEFPDGMTDDQISLAIKRDILKQEPTPVVAPQAAPEPPAEGFVARTSTALRDIPEAIARGYYNAKTGLNVLGLESGYLTPEEAAVNIAASTEAAKQYAMPESVRKGMEEIQNAQGWKETGLAIAKNLDVIPSVLGESISSSAVSMGTGLIGGLLGAGTGSVVPGFGTAVGATVGLSTGVGAGSAATEYASSLNQFLTSKGVNTSDPDQLKAAFSNPDLMSEARNDAATRGIAVGVFDALSAGIAGRLFAPVKKALGDKALGTAAGTGAEIISQSGAGAAGEATAQVATEGEITSPGAVALEAVGEIVPGIGEAVISKATGARTTAESPIPPPSSLREQALVEFYKTPGATEAATDADRISTEQLAAQDKAEADRLAGATPAAVVPPTTTEYGTSAVPTAVSTTEQPATPIPQNTTEFGAATPTAKEPAAPAVQSDSVKLANIYIDKLTEQNRPELVNKVRAIIATNDDTIINTGLSAVDTVYDMIKSGTLDPKFVSQGKITDSEGNEVAGGYMPSTQTIRLNNLDSTSAYFDPITTAAHEAVHHLDNLATGTDFARVSESIFSPIASKWQGGKDLLSLLPRSVKSQYGKAGLEYLENQLASVPEGEKNPYEVRAYLIGARTHDRMYGTTPKNRNFIGKVLDFGSEFVERFANKISGVGWTSAGDTLNAISSGKLSQGLMNLGIVANPQAAPQVASQTTPQKPTEAPPKPPAALADATAPTVEEAAVQPPKGKKKSKAAPTVDENAPITEYDNEPYVSPYGLKEQFSRASFAKDTKIPNSRNGEFFGKGITNEEAMSLTRRLGTGIKPGRIYLPEGDDTRGRAHIEKQGHIPELQDIGFNGIVDALEYVTSKRENNDFNIGGGTSYVISAIKKVNGKDVKIFAAIAPDLNDTSKHSVITLYPSTGKKPSERGATQVDRGTSERMRSLTPEQRRAMIMNKEQFSRAAAQTGENVEEFKKWWKRSKAVDTNGEPKRFYTGKATTRLDKDGKPFKSFTRAGSGVMLDAMGLPIPGMKGPFYFSPDPPFANQFAMRRLSKNDFKEKKADQVADGGRMIPVFLSVQDPFDFDNPEHVARIMQDQILKDDVLRGRIQKAFIEKGSWKEIEKTAVQGAIRRSGFDGFYLMETLPEYNDNNEPTGNSITSKNLAVYDPKQIKGVFNEFAPGTAESEQFSRARALEVIPKDMISFSTLSLLYDKPNVKAGSRTLLKTGTLLRSLHDAAFGENINLQARTPANKDKIAKFIVAEALAALSVDSNAIGWYDRKLKAAKRLMALIEPEILTNKTLEAAFDTALAITSNGQAVLKNYQDALAQYRAFKQTGKFPIIGFGDAKSAMETAFEVSNNLIDRYGMERFTSFLNTEFTVKQLQDLGFNASSDELPNSKVFGSFIFGPKIGQGFYQNLRGNFDPLTMDRWFMRFWNRIVGAPFSIPSAAAPRRAKIKSMLSDLSELDRSLIDSLSMNSERDAYSTLKNININEDEDLFDNTIMSLAKRYQSYYARMSKQGGKPFKSPLMQMVGTHFKQLKGSLQEQPRGPQERQWIREVAEEARKALATEGVDINTADLQALVWYPEKNLWTDKLGVKKGQGEDIDYSDAAEIVAKLEGIDDEVIQETRATFDGGSVDTSGDNVERADSELRGKSVSSYGQGLSDKERTKFIRQEFNRELQRLSNGKYSEDNGAFRRKRQTGDRWPVTGNKTLNLFKLGIAEKNKFERFGFSSQNIYELDPKVDAKTFLEKVTNAANNSKYGKSVTLQSLEDLSSMRLFVSEDGNYGFAINKQDIVSVFADPDTTNSASIGIMELAKQVGGRKLDAFDTILPSLYASSGFVPVARIPFDDNQAPDGWLDNNGNPEKIWQDFTGRSISDSKLAKGRPDLVFMAYDPNNTKLEYNPDDAIAVSGYEDGMAVQNSFLRSIDEEQFSRTKKPSKIVEDAKAFAAEAHANVGQLRKYTNDPYIVHPAEAVQIVSTVPHTDAMLAAAWLHDVVEDTDVTIETVREKFGGKVADLVGWLTDVSKPEQGNRAVRKAIDREHTAAAPAEAQTIKLADLISNTRSIVEYDKKFAKVYLEEKRLLLDVMTKGDATLMAEAKRMLQEGQKSLTPSDEQFSRASVPDNKNVASEEKVKAWIQKVYDKYPDTWQNSNVMILGGTGEDQQFAMFELEPSSTVYGGVNIKWFQAYPLRQGVGSRAMQELQRLATEDNIALTLWPQEKGQISQTKLTKFYKQQGFEPAYKSGKSLVWRPKQTGAEQFSRATAQQKAILARIQAAPTNDGVMSKFASEVYVKDGSLGSGLGGLKVRFIQGLFDYLAPLKLIAPNAYKKFRIANNSASIALSVIANGPIERFRGGYRTIPGAKSLTAIIDGIGKKYGPEGVHLWTGYMAAKRSKRLILEGRESLMTQADIDQMLDLINQYPEFETARKEWIEFNDKNVDFARANGTLTAREAASWKANGDYIPFYRALDDDGGLVAPGVGTLARQSDVSKKLKGSDKQLGNILENMILNTDLLVRKAIRNDALRSLEREAAGTGALQKISGVTPTSVLTTGKSIADEIADHLSKVMGIDRTDPAFDVIVQPIIDATDMSDAGLISLFGFRPNMDKDVMVVRGPSGIAGDTSTKRYYKIKDPLLVTALTFVPPTNLGFMRLLTAPKTLFTRAITMAPPFMAANLFRDTLQARVLSNANTIPFFDTTKGLYASLRNTQGAKDLQAGGGSTTNNYDSSSLNRYKKLTGSKSNPFMVVLGNAWGALEAIGNATEVANRIAIREAKLKSGASLGDANFEALDIMDFSLRGSNVIVNFMISTVPFLNARLQGMYKLGRAGFSKENRANFLLMGSMFALASLGLAAMNEDDERYKKETNVSKDNYIHIYLDKILPKEALIAAGIDKWTEDFHIALPKPFEIGAVFMTIPERMYGVYNGTQQAKDLRDSVWGIVGTTFKMHPVEMIPYPAKIAAEQVMNVDLFRKQDIVPDYKRAPGFEEAEYKYDTPEILKAFSQAVKDSTGVGISPLRAEKLIRDFAGTFGEYFMMAGDMAYREMNGMPQPINKSLLESVTGQSRFVKTNSPAYTQHEQDFYNLSKDIKSIVRVLDTFDKENPEKAEKFEEANGAYLAAEKEANKVSKQLSDLRSAKEQIYREGGPDAEAEIKDINAEENELTKEFMVYFRELEAEY